MRDAYHKELSAALDALDVDQIKGLVENKMLTTDDLSLVLLQISSQGDTKKAACLIEAGADADYPSFQSGTPLMIAANSKNKPMVALLLAHGADPLQEIEDTTAISCGAKNLEILQLMLDAIPREKRSKALQIALPSSAMYGQQDVIERFLPEMQDSEIRKKAFIEAAGSRNIIILASLYHACDNVDNKTLQHALGKADSLDAAGFVIDKIEKTSRKEMLTAALSGRRNFSVQDKEICQLFITHGAESGALLRDAIAKNVEDTIKLLDPNAEKKLQTFSHAIQHSLSPSHIKNPLNLYTLEWGIAKGEKIPPLQEPHFLTSEGNIPERFTTIVIHIPPLPADASPLAAIKRLKYIITSPNPEAASIRDADINAEHRVMIQATYHNGSKQNIGIAPEDNAIIFSVLHNEQLLQDTSFWSDRAHMVRKEDWKGLNNYTRENGGRTRGTHETYDELHTAMVEICRQNRRDTIYLEIGAGEGRLSHKLFETLSPTHNIYVIGTELHAENVETANKEHKGQFYQSNSIILLDDMEKSGAMANIEKLQKEQSLPLLINASGALNHQVLDHFQALRAIQNLHRLSPERVHITGLTDTLFNRHMVKNAGFTIERFDQNFAHSRKPFIALSSRNDKEYFQQHTDKISQTGQLDLSLNAHPLEVLQALPLDISGKIKTIDLSHSFVRTSEIEQIAEHIATHCKAVKTVQWDYHFTGKETDAKVDDQTIIHALSEKLTPHGITCLSKYVEREQELAFSRSFIEREAARKQALSTTVR